MCVPSRGPEPPGDAFVHRRTERTWRSRGDVAQGHGGLQHVHGDLGSAGIICWPMGNLQWKITIFNGKIHNKWPFSIAMLVHQRVDIFYQSPHGCV